MPKKFTEKPEGYKTEVNSWLAWGVWSIYKHEYLYANNRPMCVPHTIKKTRYGISHIRHRMEYPCNCKENADKIVRCLIVTEEGEVFIGEHFPGECPGLVYKKKRQKEYNDR